MPGTGLPKGERRRRRRNDGGESSGEVRQGGKAQEWRRKVILIWSVLLSGVVLVILGISVWLWIIPNMQAKKNVTNGQSIQLEREKFIKPAIPSLPEEEAIALVKHALAVREPERVLEYFRPGTSSPGQIVDFLKSLDEIDGKLSRVELLGSIDGNAMTIDGLVATFKGKDKPRNRVAMLTPDDGGNWKVDYDAFARTATPSWNEFLEKGAKSAQVRIYAAADSYYNGVFMDETQWICYGIASPDTESILMAYCRRNSPQAAAMASIFKKGAKLNRATLEIRRVEGAESRQVEISRVMAEDWVLGATPFEDRFK